MFCKCRRKGLTCLYLFFQRQMPMRRRSTKDSHHLTGSGLPSEILQAASKSRPWPPPGLSNSPPHTIKSKYLKNWTEGGRGVKNLTIAVPSVICSFWSPERAPFNVFFCLLWIGVYNNIYNRWHPHMERASNFFFFFHHWQAKSNQTEWNVVFVVLR